MNRRHCYITIWLNSTLLSLATANLWRSSLAQTITPIPNAFYMSVVMNPAIPTATPIPTARRTPAATATATLTPQPTAAVTPLTTATTPSLYICSRDAYNCSDFSTQAQAQAVFDYCMDRVGSDVHRLDSNNDGEACESLPLRLW